MGAGAVLYAAGEDTFDLALRAIVDYCPDRYPRRFEATRFSVADPDVLPQTRTALATLYVSIEDVSTCMMPFSYE
jgi:hypothetical protein